MTLRPVSATAFAIESRPWIPRTTWEAERWASIWANPCIVAMLIRGQWP